MASPRADAGRVGPAGRHPWELARARFFRRLIARSTEVGAVRRVLDVGAGDGWFAEELLPDLGPAAEVVCWDVNYRSEDLATPVGARLTRTNGRPAGSFDLVLLLDVLEHIEDAEGFLAGEDVAHLAAAMEPGSTAGSAQVWENLWAAPFASAARRSAAG